MYKYRTSEGMVPLSNSSQSTQRNSRSNYSSRPTSSRPSSQPPRFKKPRKRKSIELTMFVKKAIPIKEQMIEIEHQFTDFAFPQIIHENLKAKGYVLPSPIQDKTIQPILDGRDVVGLAATGTGKTAAFLLPILTQIVNNPKSKALIIAPTRELAQQIYAEFNTFSLRTSTYAAVCVGGMPIYHQIKELRRGHNLVIGTPGRLKDLSDRGHIDYSTFSHIVLDEVDHMLDMGFVEEITVILQSLREQRQSLFFSATMPERIRSLVDTYTTNPFIVELSVGRTTDNVEQDIIRVKDNYEKIEELHTILSDEACDKALIFTETKIAADRLCTELTRRGHYVMALHGDKHQRERMRALKMFKEKKINVLVATDVAARGLDIPNVSHVFNYTVPMTHEDYIHRIGRTGRGSSIGTALTFVDDEEFASLSIPIPTRNSGPRRNYSRPRPRRTYSR